MSNQVNHVNSINKKAIGSFMIGMIAIFGLIFIKEGTILSLVGLLIGVISLKEGKQLNQRGAILALVGITFNVIGCIGFIWLFI
ncbi:hypothetical protein [Aquibacillus kalidii]|uniref:hypothetical protein n=1 Tax=Aquibacillus kalidii TaxID=2762597 RepID=UPI0016456358|nr:hypothetical protein [Aquibacillus kalidii]